MGSWKLELPNLFMKFQWKDVRKLLLISPIFALDIKLCFHSQCSRFSSRLQNTDVVVRCETIPNIWPICLIKEITVYVSGFCLFDSNYVLKSFCMKKKTNILDFSNQWGHNFFVFLIHNLCGHNFEVKKITLKWSLRSFGNFFMKLWGIFFNFRPVLRNFEHMKI